MEQVYIQACLSHCLYPECALPAPPPGLDWDRVYVLLRRHRLAGLFYVLGRAHSGLWPKGLRERLREDRYHALLRGDWCTEQVHNVLSGLRQASIPVIVLKGWALIPTLYGGDYGQRTYDDIDLLVPPHLAARAEDILHELGYRGLRVEPWAGHRWRYETSWAYRLPQDHGPSAGVFSIGLHWGLLNTPFYDRRMPVQELLDRAQPLTVSGVEVRRLAAEDDLVYACGHLALHHEYDPALFRYYEMASTVLQAGSAFNWSVVLERACSWRLIIPLQRVLTYLERLWPGLVPPNVLEGAVALRPARAERVVHRILVGNPDNHVIRAAVDWLTMAGLIDRIRYPLGMAFPNPAYMRKRYGPAPGGLWPLLYFRRAAAAVKHLTAAASRKEKTDPSPP